MLHTCRCSTPVAILQPSMWNWGGASEEERDKLNKQLLESAALLQRAHAKHAKLQEWCVPTVKPRSEILC